MRPPACALCLLVFCSMILLFPSSAQSGVLHWHKQIHRRHRHTNAAQPVESIHALTINHDRPRLAPRGANTTPSKEDKLRYDISSLQKSLPELEDDFLAFLRSISVFLRQLENIFGSSPVSGQSSITPARLPETSVTANRGNLIPGGTGLRRLQLHSAPSHLELSTIPAPGQTQNPFTVPTPAKVLSNPYYDCTEGGSARSGHSAVGSNYFKSAPRTSIHNPQATGPSYSLHVTHTSVTVENTHQTSLTEESRIIPSSPRTATVTLTSTVTNTRTTTKTLSTSAAGSNSRTRAVTSSSATSGFDPQATNNIAVYYGQTPPTTADGLLMLCAIPSITIINLAFLATFFGPNGYPATYFGPACSSTQSSIQSSTAPGLQNCTYLGQQISACQQQYGKKIFVSLGGYIASSSFPTFSSATAFAATLWNLFGAGNGTGNPTSTTPAENAQLRPFGPNITVDGFDIDNEDHNTSYWLEFATALRTHFASSEALASRKQYYLSSTPQCPRPDASIPLDVLQLSDFVNVQFYNNPGCNLDAGTGFLDSVVAWAGDLVNGTAGQSAATADSEARRPGFAIGKGRKPGVIPQTGYGLRRPGGPKLLIGVPGWPGAGSGYVPGIALAGIMHKVKRRLARAGFANVLGGMMTWDGTEAVANVDSQRRTFVDAIAAALA